MTKRYTTADQDVTEFISGVMKKHHKPLVDAGVTFCALMLDGAPPAT